MTTGNRRPAGALSLVIRVCVYHWRPSGGPAGPLGHGIFLMLLYSAATVAGFALLIWGADRFVFGAAATAHNLGVPSLLIGLTVVALATSAPEILVSVSASMDGNSALAIGNAVGSNIANIALVLGATALVQPLSVRSSVLQREMPALLAVTLLCVMLMLNGALTRLDGAVLLAGLFVVMHWLVRLATDPSEADPIKAEIEAEIPDRMPMPHAVMWLAIGFVVLLGGAEILVWGAHNIAVALSVSDLIIGLTVVAIGTSLPELAVSLVSALKKEHDIALGNIVGSNMFNCLAVIGPAALIDPKALDASLLQLHLPVMIALTLLLFGLTYNFTGSGRISRAHGGVLLLVFLTYEGHILGFF